MENLQTDNWQLRSEKLKKLCKPSTFRQVFTDFVTVILKKSENVKRKIHLLKFCIR